MVLCKDGIEWKRSLHGRASPLDARALPWPPDRTQSYHEPPYRGLPLHCCGIDHAFLDR
ncbi:hypothetical protein J6590_081851 [Homalodisca vitripennis]|nr:hypothetical protein J6590_081851 [Homalodisca vitripennis]